MDVGLPDLAWIASAAAAVCVMSALARLDFKGALMFILVAQSIKSQTLLGMPMPQVFVSLGHGFYWWSGHIDVVSLLGLESLVLVPFEPIPVTAEEGSGEEGAGSRMLSESSNSSDWACGVDSAPDTASGFAGYASSLHMSRNDMWLNTALVAAAVGLLVVLLLLLVSRVILRRHRSSPAQTLRVACELALLTAMLLAVEEGLVLVSIGVLSSGCSAPLDVAVHVLAWIVLVVLGLLVGLAALRLRRNASLRGDAPLFVWRCTCQVLIALLLALRPSTVHAAEEGEEGAAEGSRMLSEDEPSMGSIDGVGLQVYGCLVLHVLSALLSALLVGTLPVALVPTRVAVRGAHHGASGRHPSRNRVGLFGRLGVLASTLTDSSVTAHLGIVAAWATLAGAYGTEARVGGAAATAVLVINLGTLYVLIVLEIVLSARAQRSCLEACLAARNQAKLGHRGGHAPSPSASEHMAGDEVLSSPPPPSFADETGDYYPPGPGGLVGRNGTKVNQDNEYGLFKHSMTGELFLDGKAKLRAEKEHMELLGQLRPVLEPPLGTFFGLDWDDLERDLTRMQTNELRLGLSRPEAVITMAVMKKRRPKVMRKMKVFQEKRARELAAKLAARPPTPDFGPELPEKLTKPHRPPPPKPSPDPISAAEFAEMALWRRKIALFKETHPGICWRYALRDNCKYHRDYCPIGIHNQNIKEQVLTGELWGKLTATDGTDAETEGEEAAEAEGEEAAEEGAADAGADVEQRSHPLVPRLDLLPPEAASNEAAAAQLTEANLTDAQSILEARMVQDAYQSRTGGEQRLSRFEPSRPYEGRSAALQPFGSSASVVQQCSLSAVHSDPLTASPRPFDFLMRPIPTRLERLQPLNALPPYWQEPPPSPRRTPAASTEPPGMSNPEAAMMAMRGRAAERRAGPPAPVPEALTTAPRAAAPEAPTTAPMVAALEAPTTAPKAAAPSDDSSHKYLAPASRLATEAKLDTVTKRVAALKAALQEVVEPPPESLVPGAAADVEDDRDLDLDDRALFLSVVESITQEARDARLEQEGTVSGADRTPLWKSTPPAAITEVVHVHRCEARPQQEGAVTGDDRTPLPQSAPPAAIPQVVHVHRWDMPGRTCFGKAPEAPTPIQGTLPGSDSLGRHTFGSPQSFGGLQSTELHRMPPQLAPQLAYPPPPQGYPPQQQGYPPPQQGYPPPQGHHRSLRPYGHRGRVTAAPPVWPRGFFHRERERMAAGPPSRPPPANALGSGPFWRLYLQQHRVLPAVPAPVLGYRDQSRPEYYGNRD
jgi:hypothetical protein